MRNRTRALIAVVVAVVIVFFIFAPVVYSPTKVYIACAYVGSSGCVNSSGVVVTQPNMTYPNWNSLSCWAFGFGVYYGLTVYQHGDSFQFGCHPPPFWSGL